MEKCFLPMFFQFCLRKSSVWVETLRKSKNKLSNVLGNFIAKRKCAVKSLIKLSPNQLVSSTPARHSSLLWPHIKILTYKHRSRKRFASNVNTSSSNFLKLTKKSPPLNPFSSQLWPLKIGIVSIDEMISAMPWISVPLHAKPRRIGSHTLNCPTIYFNYVINLNIMSH